MFEAGLFWFLTLLFANFDSADTWDCLWIKRTGKNSSGSVAKYKTNSYYCVEDGVISHAKPCGFERAFLDM